VANEVKEHQLDLVEINMYPVWLSLFSTLTLRSSKYNVDNTIRWHLQPMAIYTLGEHRTMANVDT